MFEPGTPEHDVSAPGTPAFGRPPGCPRPPWEEYFMEIARVVSTRSSCLRRHVGAVVVKNRQILSTGYNGVPRGLAHCEERGCLRDQLGIPSGERHELCRGLHAE
jgi:dCMP deaminase